MRQFDKDPDIDVIFAKNGALEVGWPEIKTVEYKPRPGVLLAHKFTAYIYLEDALHYLADSNPNRLYILCIRNPAKSLVSWRKMHRSISNSPTPIKHFAWQERDFYSKCSLTEYYEKYAQKRLRYAFYLERLLPIIPRENLVVVSQEYMAKGIDIVADHIKSLAKNEPVENSASIQSPLKSSRDVHQGYADKANEKLEGWIADELDAVQHRLSLLIATEIKHKYV
jgi:hypothetical protein